MTGDAGTVSGIVSVVVSGGNVISLTASALPTKARVIGAVNLLPPRYSTPLCAVTLVGMGPAHLCALPDEGLKGPEPSRNKRSPRILECALRYCSTAWLPSAVIKGEPPL